jgi:hypothetical protein
MVDVIKQKMVYRSKSMENTAVALLLKFSDNN